MVYRCERYLHDRETGKPKGYPRVLKLLLGMVFVNTETHKWMGAAQTVQERRFSPVSTWCPPQPHGPERGAEHTRHSPQQGLADGTDFMGRALRVDSADNDSAAEWPAQGRREEW